MPVYNAKSHEELRWEDYNINRKGGFGVEPASKTPSWNYPGPTTTWSTSRPLEFSFAANTWFTTPSSSFNLFTPKTTLASTTVSAPNVNSFNRFLSGTTPTSTTVSTPKVNSSNPYLPGITFSTFPTPTSTAVSTPNVNPFSTFPTPSSTAVSTPNVNPFSTFPTPSSTAVSTPNVNPFSTFPTPTSTAVSTPNVNPFSTFPTPTSTSVSTPNVNPFSTFPTPTSTTVSTPNVNPFSTFLRATTPTSTTVSTPNVNSFSPFLPRTPTSTTVSAPDVNSFNMFLPRTTITSTTVSAPHVNSFSPILPSFSRPTSPLPSNAFWSTPVREPEIPGLNSTCNQPTTLVHPFAPSSQNCSAETIGQSSASQLSSSQITSVEQQSSAASPFGTLPPRPQMISQSTQPIQYGISSIAVKDKPAPFRLPLLTTRHLSSRSKLPLRKYDPKLNGPKKPFFDDTKEILVDVFVPRENPRALVLSPEVWQRMAIAEKFPDKDPAKDEEFPKTTLDIPIKHPQTDYYTEPPISELEAKERADPGFCKHVKDFVVGRHGYGSIKFLGETDVRNLDLESHVQFNYREVIVYMDDTKKPPVGEGLNKPAEITLLNIKCFDKKTGMQYVEGSKMDKYKQKLKKTAVAQGVEFMSYDPVEGEWKFRVQHF